MVRVILSLFFFCAAALGAEEYEVRMTRPAKVGERLLITGNYKASQSLEVKADGNFLKSDETTLEFDFEAERETIEVSEFGKTSHAQGKIRKIEGTFNGAPITQLKAGDVLESKVDGARDKITVNGQPATPQQDQLARGIVETSKGGSTTDDDAFGPGRKVKVGDEWSINPEAAAKSAGEVGVAGLKPEDLKGTVKFVEVTEHGGKPHLHLRGAVEMKGAGMPVPNAPLGIKVDALVASIKLDSEYPVDPTSIVPSADMGMAMRMEASGELERDGQKVKLETTGKFIKQLKARATLLP